jgi:hypothetical protein
MSIDNGVYQSFVKFIKLHPNSTLGMAAGYYLAEKTKSTPEKPYTFAHLSSEIQATHEAFRVVINLLKEKGLLQDNNGLLKFHQILDPIPKRLVGFIETNPLMEFMNENPDSVGPVEYRNTDVKDLVQRIQGDRGTCVGQACANVKDLTSIPFDRPDITDKESYRRDIKDPDGLIHDNLFYTSASAECTYQISRRLGNITAPSGSYTYLGMKALTGGACFEDEWPTSKTPYMTLPNPRPDMKDAVTISMANHKIDGYATLYPLTFENCKAALHKYHTVAGSFDIYENYGSMMGGDGTFPEPKGEVIGGHALCLYGYDADYLYCVHTWGDWCGRFGKISRHYFDTCCNDIFCPIETAEMERLNQDYTELQLYSNTPANFYLIQDGLHNYIGTYTKDKLVIHLKKGVSVLFYVEALDFYNINASEGYTPDADYGILFVKLPIPEVPTGFWDSLIAWFKKVFGK